MTYKKQPLRMCVACREMKLKDELIKVTKNKDGNFFLNDAKAEGRSAYVCKTQECLKKCRKTRGFNRAFKKEVPEQIYALAEEIFEQKN